MSKKKFRMYEVGLDSDVFAISLVDDPAIEVDFVALSRQKPAIALNSEKHIVLGPALIPDKPIYRDQDGEQFYITFPKETIERLAHNYLASDRVYSFTKDHEGFADGIYVIETWLKTSESDKSADYGFNCPIGTWFVAAKVDDEETWKQIKSGDLKGFSIEALVDLKEINKLIEQSQMAKKAELETVEINESFWDKLKAIIAEIKGVPADAPEVEEVVEEVAEEISEEEVQMEGEQPQEEASVEEAVEEAVAEAVATVEEAVEPEKEADALQAVVDELKAEIESKNAEIEELKKKCQKMAKQPSAKPVVKQSANRGNSRDIMEAIANGTYFSKK